MFLFFFPLVLAAVVSTTGINNVNLSSRQFVMPEGFFFWAVKAIMLLSNTTEDKSHIFGNSLRLFENAERCVVGVYSSHVVMV